MFGKVLRRRWVLAVIFSCSLLYFVINIQKQLPHSAPLESTDHTPRPKLKPEAILWNNEETKNTSKLETCRNSVQGKELLTDERGYLCPRQDVDSSGCCVAEAPNTRRYVCDSCGAASNCCELYEHCVSCCLQPEKEAVLKKLLGRVSDQFQNLFAAVTDQFELCLTKCRTSSLSVLHENSYRNPRAKFCYGDEKHSDIWNP